MMQSTDRAGHAGLTGFSTKAVQCNRIPQTEVGLTFLLPEDGPIPADFPLYLAIVALEKSLSIYKFGHLDGFGEQPFRTASSITQ